MSSEKYGPQLIAREWRSIVLKIALSYLFISCLLGGPILVWAVNPDKPISQYEHTSWKFQDGFLNGEVDAIAETTDGYLWIGTSAGLVRFDGVRFVPWSAPSSKQLASSTIWPLLGTQDGSLWVGSRNQVLESALSRWTNHVLTSVNLPSPKHIGSILEDRDGNVWIEQFHFANEQGSLCEVLYDKLQCYGRAEGLPESPAFYRAFTADKDGYLWVGGDTGVARWKPGSSTVYRPTGLQSGAAIGGVQALAADADGSLWVGMVAGHGLGLEHLINGSWRPMTAPGFDSSGLQVSSLLIDSHNTLWVGTYTQGLYRISGNHVDHFGSVDGLSSNRVIALFEDRDGDLWVGTSDGLDNFRDTAVSTFSTRQGLCTEEVDSVLASHDGTIWIGGGEALCILRNGHVASLPIARELLGHQITSFLEDHAHRVWIGFDNKLAMLKDGKLNQLRKSDGSPLGMIAALAEDSQGNVWAENTTFPRTLFRIRDGRVQDQFTSPQMPGARSLASDPQGGIWLGLTTGDLARYRDGHIDILRFRNVPDNFVDEVVVNPDGSVFGATGFGLIAWKNGKQQILSAQNGLPCEGVNAFISDDSNNLWLYLDCALVEIPATEMVRWWKNSSSVLQPKCFDRFDGFQPGTAPFTKAAKTSDGRLWFANRHVLQVIDPTHLPERTISPPALVEEVFADRKSYATEGVLRLPPLVRDLEIDYTVPSFARPQQVRFRYMLEGHDPGWREPGTRRQAFYTDLGPGRYRFRVVAQNAEGAWSNQEADLDFRIAPAWFQTIWFRLLCVASGILAIWSVYWLRVRQATTVMSARFDERLAERTRVARELHDTFLQTIQGSKLVAEDALENSGDPLRTRHALQQLSEWLSRAADEARAALNSLRASTIEKNDLAEAFQRTLDECRRETSIHATLSVTGNACEIHPLVRDEILRIGCEAIRNACTHSAGSSVEVELSYGQDLVMRIFDNGVGIDAATANAGKDRHFGLIGMRERAARIGAKFTVISSPSSGTEIKLVIPGRIIFHQPLSTPVGRTKALVKHLDDN